MKRRLLFLFFLYTLQICATPNIYSQNNYESTSDDLDITFNIKNSFSKYYSKQQEILELLIDAETMNIRGKTESAQHLFRKALDMSKKENFGVGIVDAKISIGKVLYNQGEFDKSLKCFLEARKLAQRISYIEGLALTINYIGKYHHSTGDFAESFQLFNQGLSIALAINDSTIISELYRNIGNYYITTGNRDKALEQFFYARAYANLITDPLNYASVDNHLGNVYQMQKDFEKSLYYHRHALELRKKYNYAEGVGKSLKNIGEVFEEMEILDSALIYYNKALNIFEKVGYKKGMVKCHNNMGYIILDKDIAYNHLRKAQQLASEMGYVKGIVKAEYSLAKYYNNIEHYKAELSHLNTALSLSKQNGMKGMEKNALLALFEIEQKLGRFQYALNYYQQYAQVKEELNSEARELYFEEIQLSFEIKDKEKQNEILRTENELKTVLIQRKNLLITGTCLVIAMLLILITITYSSLSRNKKANQILKTLNNEVSETNKKLKIVNEELIVANNEKDKLYSILAHELRNPLQWFRQITGMLNKKFEEMPAEKMRKTLLTLDESANQAYHLLDNLLQWTRSQLGKVKFNPETLNLKSAINENIHFARSVLHYKEINVTINCPEEAEVIFDKMMLHTVLRNLISNAIKFTPTRGKVEIISKILNKEFIQIIIIDSGVGIPPDAYSSIFNAKEKFTTIGLMQEKGSGLGLVLCKDFVEKNNGEIWFESQPDKGSTFAFTCQQN